MTDKDRTRLARAMGENPYLFGPLDGNPIFDPFKDANHDYAVLEWMRPDDWINSVPIKGPDHARYRDFIFELRLLERLDSRPSGPISQGYQIGDYARAALKVLDESP